MSRMLPLEVLVLIYGRVHRAELEAAAMERWSGRWDCALGGAARDDAERGGPPGIHRLLTLSHTHHAAIASALADWHSWPDSCYGPGAAIWVSGIACTSGSRAESFCRRRCHECAGGPTDDWQQQPNGESRCGHDPKDDGIDDGGNNSDDEIQDRLCDSGRRCKRRNTRIDIAVSRGHHSGSSAVVLHPVLADRRLHGLWFGAGVHLPACWLGTPARHIVDIAAHLTRTASPDDQTIRHRWHGVLVDLMGTRAWPKPCLVLRVQVAHMCTFALNHAHQFPTLTLTRTYFCAPGGSSGASFTVGGIVDAVADFYAGSPMALVEMERIKAYARSVWRAYERHYGRPWDRHDFGPGGGARVWRADQIDESNGAIGSDNEDGGDDDDAERNRYIIDMATIDHAPRVMHGRDPYRGGPGPRDDVYERRFASWFSEVWLGEGDLSPRERTLTRQFADPERYGRPRLIDLAPRPGYDDLAPRLSVGRFGAGKRAGVCQLSVLFGRMPDA